MLFVFFVFLFLHPWMSIYNSFWALYFCKSTFIPKGKNVWITSTFLSPVSYVSFHFFADNFLRFHFYGLPDDSCKLFRNGECGPTLPCWHNVRNGLLGITRTKLVYSKHVFHWYSTDLLAKISSKWAHYEIEPSCMYLNVNPLHSVFRLNFSTWGGGCTESCWDS
jgi:hypothetical protein